MAIPLGKRRPGTSPWLASMQTQWERGTLIQMRPYYVLKTSGKKKKQNNKIREVWNCLCLSPQHGFLINALGLQMQVFPMIPRLDCLTGATDIAFILPWLCPSWGGGTSCRLWAGEASMDSSPPCSPLPALRLLPADSSHYSLFRYKLAFLWKWFWTRFLSFLQTTG